MEAPLLSKYVSTPRNLPIKKKKLSQPGMKSRCPRLPNDQIKLCSRDIGEVSQQTHHLTTPKCGGQVVTHHVVPP